MRQQKPVLWDRACVYQTLIAGRQAGRQARCWPCVRDSVIERQRENLLQRPPDPYSQCITQQLSTGSCHCCSALLLLTWIRRWPYHIWYSWPPSTHLYTPLIKSSACKIPVYQSLIPITMQEMISLALYESAVYTTCMQFKVANYKASFYLKDVWVYWPITRCPLTCYPHLM